MALESDGGTCSFLAPVVQSSILQWQCLQDSVAAHLSGKLSKSPATPPEQWRCLLSTVFREGVSPNGDTLLDVMRSDLSIIKERDPACPSLAHALLFYKGFHAIQLHRAANVLWRRRQCTLASLLQSISSEVFSVDIHPAARIGRSLFIDHATGVVIGETAVVGSGCTFLHGVTLGGTGKTSGDRHPKVGSNVLVGAGASILGNVTIGDGAKIGAAALVLTDIPPKATAVGAPAKVVGRTKEDNPASKMDTACRFVDTYRKRTNLFCPFRHLDKSNKGFLGPYEFVEKLSKQCRGIRDQDALNIFFEMDKDKNGELTAQEFDENIEILENFLARRASVDCCL